MPVKAMRKGPSKNKLALPEPNSKVAKYFFAVKAGSSKAEAARMSGYANPNQTNVIERTDGFKALQAHYKDELLRRIPLGIMADEHAKIIMQDNEMGPKLAAIKIAMDKIEPPGESFGDGDDQVFVVLR